MGDSEDDDVPVMATLRSFLLLGDNSDSEAHVQSALERLSGFVEYESRYRKDEIEHGFLHLGGQLFVVTMMRTYANNEGIQNFAVSAINNLCTEHTAVTTSFGQIRGAERILEAMERFPINTRIQSNGSEALYKILFTSRSERNLFVSEHNGLSRLVEVMHNMPGEEDAVEAGCKILNLLAETEQYRSHLMTCGGIHIMCAALRQFPDNGTIRECVGITLFVCGEHILHETRD